MKKLPVRTAARRGAILRGLSHDSKLSLTGYVSTEPTTCTPLQWQMRWEIAPAARWRQFAGDTDTGAARDAHLMLTANARE
jgi:hypothetical protein